MKNNAMTLLLLPIILLSLILFVIIISRRKIVRPDLKRLNINRIVMILIIIFVLVSAILYYFGTFFMNKWSLLTCRGFFIPSESSIYSFKQTVQNAGSGEWWIYGEDETNFYYAGDGVSPYPYMFIEKKDATQCPDFNPINFNTWCKKNRPIVNAPQ